MKPFSIEYPADFTPEPEGGFSVTFPDIPEAITYGETMQEAVKMAEEALVAAFEFYVEDRRRLPFPTKPKAGQRLVVPPLQLALKMAIHQGLLARNERPVDLARLLEVDYREVQRILNLRHNTKLGTLEKALRALGLHATFHIMDAA